MISLGEIEPDAITFLRTRNYDPTRMSDDIGDICSMWMVADAFQMREEFIAQFGFAIPTRDILDVISRYAPILEVGSGCGYWAYELRRRGVDIVATDPGTGRYAFQSKGAPWRPWTKIEALTADHAIAAYPDRTLLVVWPDYADPWAADALCMYPEDIVLYVGEGADGCTADEAFHARLAQDFDEERVLAIPVFYGLHDRLFVYRRRKSTNQGGEHE